MIESASMTRRLGVVLALCALAGVATADQAKPKKGAPAAKKEAAPPPADDPAPPADDGSAAADEQMPPHIEGPKLVDIGNNTEVDLPAGLILLERVEAAKIIEQNGGSSLGLEASVYSPDGDWWVRIDYEDAGYVSDSDASELDPNDIFKSFQDGTVEQNTRRRGLGLPEMFLDGWTVMPKYDKALHHLSWGLKGHSERGVSVNEFTRVLGRNGYLSVNLISSADKIDAARAAATPLLTGIRFKSGFAYDDHKSGDKSSGMGLKALVLGGAAVGAFKLAKAGVFVKLFAFLGKGLIVVFAGIAAFFKKIFGGRAKTPTDLPPDGPPVG
jgi:uncharacterized membrane-anchored protein